MAVTLVLPNKDILIRINVECSSTDDRVSKMLSGGVMSFVLSKTSMTDGQEVHGVFFSSTDF